MQGVLPMTARASGGRLRRGWAAVSAVLAPALGAALAAALLLHLMVTLIRHLGETDSLGLITVAAGVAVAVALLLPFAVVLAVRAHKAWQDAPELSHRN